MMSMMTPFEAAIRSASERGESFAKIDDAIKHLQELGEQGKDVQGYAIAVLHGEGRRPDTHDGAVHWHLLGDVRGISEDMAVGDVTPVSTPTVLWDTSDRRVDVAPYTLIPKTAYDRDEAERDE